MAGLQEDDDTLTRGDYARLSDVQILDSFSYSGSFDDPTSLLDKHPYDAVRPLPQQVILADNVDADYSEISTLSNYPREEEVRYEEVSYDDELMVEPEDYSDEYSYSTDEDLLEEPIPQTRDRGDTNIDIIGSLCLQGIMQGLVTPISTERKYSSEILPMSIRMTANLENQHAALDELSVMVTRMEIVPESPYNPNSGTKSSSTAPHKRFHSKVPLSTRPRSDTVVNKIDVRLTSVTYIDNIVRAQPLPPIDKSLSNNEIKRYKVVENLLESEAGFLTSLNIAIELYQKPLQKDTHTELSSEKVKKLFGPIRSILEHHELFFAALSEQTKAWAPDKQIGDVFLASFTRKEVVKHYREYVNNFAMAMNILEKSIKKKQRFVEFLKKQMSSSGSVLSLQALLLKPIQRFPQYLLFLHDLIKYTPSSHSDSVVLEMAEAHIEGIASYLNEAKRRSEYLTIVLYLNSKIEKLPVDLLEKNSALYRQDIIQWAVRKDEKWMYKERELFLFNHLIVCCSVSQNSKNIRSSVIDADQVMSGETTPRLVCKWACPISQVEIIDPDYMKETSPLVIGGSETVNTKLKNKYKELKDEMQTLNQDFELLYKICGLTASLSQLYETLNIESIQNSCRVLQRKLEESQELIRSCCEPCRVDITITRSDGSRYHQILLFASKRVREDWIRDLQLAKLRQNPSNQQMWVTDEDDADDIDGGLEGEEDKSPTCRETDNSLPNETLPLLVDYTRLSHSSEISSVEYATSVGNSRVWFATGSSCGAYISIIRCFMPTPMLIETFSVHSRKILSMKVIPTTYSPTSDCSTLTVWIGSECGKLMLYDAGTSKCLQTVQLNDSILCIEKYKNVAFVGTANGSVYVYTRAKGSHWNVTKPVHQIPISNKAIQCFCAVDDKLWIGVQKSCIIMNMQTLHLEASIKVTHSDTACVKRMEKAGAGVWVALNRGAILYLFHKDTRKPIQEINIKGSLSNIIACARMQDKFGSIDDLYITALLADTGYLWVGTSSGAILIYRIPPLKGLPLLNGRPFLASDGHNRSVLTLVAVKTQMDNSTARFDQFVSDEKERMIGSYNITHKQNEELTEAVAQTATIRIDDSALPRVEQVIKKLELGKQLLQSMSKSLPRPIPKPRTKKKKKNSESALIVAPIMRSPMVPEVSPLAEVNTVTNPVTVTVTESVPAEYELPTPVTATELVQDEEQPVVYSEVPVEEDEIQTCSSDISITPLRYQGQPILTGEVIYEHIRSATITMSIPGREVMPSLSSNFVFSGGNGLVNFRQSSDSPDPRSTSPYVITYQIP